MTCHREDELLDALARGYTGDELREHVASCASCAELQAVAGALLNEHSVAIAEAAVPSSATMWWRLRIRERHDAEAAARRSLYIGQAATLLIAFGLVVAFFGNDFGQTVRALVASIHLSTPLLLAIATWLVAAPVAGWVAIRQK
ncbi:MAG TPA: hypothetical protein VFN10_18515 [Thermoanaerobaculia bacterium]|nr:hypothetical protein [Thermoanaerobaculia bacterium]